MASKYIAVLKVGGTPSAGLVDFAMTCSPLRDRVLIGNGDIATWCANGTSDVQASLNAQALSIATTNGAAWVAGLTEYPRSRTMLNLSICLIFEVYDSDATSAIVDSAITAATLAGVTFLTSKISKDDMLAWIVANCEDEDV